MINRKIKTKNFNWLSEYILFDLGKLLGKFQLIALIEALYFGKFGRDTSH